MRFEKAGFTYIYIYMFLERIRYKELGRHLTPIRADLAHFPSSRPPTLIAVARLINGHALACASRQVVKKVLKMT